VLLRLFRPSTFPRPFLFFVVLVNETSYGCFTGAGTLSTIINSCTAYSGRTKDTAGLVADSDSVISKFRAIVTYKTPKSRNVKEKAVAAPRKSFCPFIVWSSTALKAITKVPHPAMNTSASNSESQKSGQTGKRYLKVNKACTPCRTRKVKCDGAVTGFPCSSCTSRQCAEDCLLPARKNRTRLVELQGSSGAC